MILLIGGGGQTVYRGWMGQGLVLGGERRRGDLSDHEAGVDPAIVDQKRRQAGHPRVDQQRHPPL